MTKILKQIYFLIFLIVIGILTWIEIRYQPKPDQLPGSNSVSFNEGWSYENNGIITRISATFPQNIAVKNQDEVIMMNTLPETEIEDMVLAFFSHHQLIHAYVDGKLIYQLDLSSDPLKITPGIVWNRIDIPRQFRGKRIEIHFYPVFSDFLGYQTGFQIGNRYDILEKEFSARLIPLLFCLAIFTFGVTFIFRSFFFRRIIKDFRNIFYLGIFATGVAIWSLTLTNLPQMLMNIAVLAYYVKYAGLLFLPYPMLLFAQESFTEGKNRMIQIALKINLILIIGQSIFHIAKISNLRQMLPVTHLFYFFTLLIIFLATIQAIRREWGKQNWRRWIDYIGTLLVIFASIADTIHYYQDFPADSSRLFRISLFIFLCFLGYKINYESHVLMEQGIQTETIRKMAFVDVLTGIRNRAAFMQDLKEIRQANFYQIRLVMMDMNNLKSVNDQYGHSAGDSCIIQSANLLSKVFQQFGRSYRLSGDEFCSILWNCSSDNYQICVDELQTELEKINTTIPYQIQIACGSAIFDPQKDSDLIGTLKRADEKMYENKQYLKKNANE